MQLMDGDYTGIALPPGHEDVDHIATRCLVTAYHCGLSIQDILQRHTHTLHILGWSNHVVQPPLVPMQREDDDAHFLLQQSMTTTPALPDIPLFLRRQQCRILGQHFPLNIPQ